MSDLDSDSQQQNQNSERIRLATSIPSLKNKIQINLSSDSKDVFWYIRFNIALDESTVSDKTMQVTDTLGYIMRTDINYNQEKHMIVISPIDSYEENIYYLLSVSKNVRSAKGQYLKSKIHILFKLLGKEISNFKVLKQDVTPPKPKPRPKDYDEKITKAKLLSIGEELMQNVPQGNLPYMPIKVNIIFAFIGVLLMITNFFINNLIFWGVVAVVCGFGFWVLISGLLKVSERSAVAYNIGIFNFNKENYEKANEMFKKAHTLDASNKYAIYALNKITYYL